MEKHKFNQYLKDIVDAVRDGIMIVDTEASILKDEQDEIIGASGGHGHFHALPLAR